MPADDFLTLWDSYRTLIAKFIHDRVRYECQETREDMVQEVYARAWSAMCKGRGASTHPRGWLFTIAANLIVDYYRDRGRKPVHEPLVDFIVDAQPEPQEVVAATLAVERMQRLASTLTPMQELVVLRRMDGYAFSEIASEMESSEIAVKAVKYRASRQMLKYLEAL